MELTVSERGDIHLVRLTGVLDGQTSPATQAALADLVADGATKLLVDFEQLSFISSAGLRVLLIIAKTLQHTQGELRICQASTSVLEVFRISGFDTILRIDTTQDDALQDF